MLFKFCVLCIVNKTICIGGNNTSDYLYLLNSIQHANNSFYYASFVVDTYYNIMVIES